MIFLHLCFSKAGIVYACLFISDNNCRFEKLLNPLRRWIIPKAYCSPKRQNSSPSGKRWCRHSEPYILPNNHRTRTQTAQPLISHKWFSPYFLLTKLFGRLSHDIFHTILIFTDKSLLPYINAHTYTYYTFFYPQNNIKLTSVMLK